MGGGGWGEGREGRWGMGGGGRWDMLSSEYSDADHVTHLMVVKGAMMRIM